MISHGKNACKKSARIFIVKIACVICRGTSSNGRALAAQKLGTSVRAQGGPGGQGQGKGRKEGGIQERTKEGSE